VDSPLGLRRNQPLVLVVRHQGLGDLLTALPSLRAIRRAYPDHALAVTCPPALEPLALRLGVADEWVTSRSATQCDPSRHEDVDADVVRAAVAAGAEADVVVALRVPDNPGLTAALQRLAPRRLIAYGQNADVPFHFEDHILTRWSRLLTPHGIVARPNDLYSDLDLAAPEGSGDVVVLHVGAASAARRWPVDRWARVAAELEARCGRVVVTGSPLERPLGEWVVESAALPAERNLAGSTGILDLAGLVRRARLVLSTDTGIAHLATCFCTPAVTLFGPVPPTWWGPPPWHQTSRALWRGTYGEPYADVPDPGLLRIHVDDVLVAVSDLLDTCGTRGK
jgi:ADP-heptose:LPS heptosyltransferase